MKLRLFLIPAIFATTAALADSQTAVSLKRSSSVSETAIDAHASAAALLSGQRVARQATASSAVREPLHGQTHADAHAQAAALLSGTRTAAGSLRSQPVHGATARGLDF
jgi:hypothetical protein